MTWSGAWNRRRVLQLGATLATELAAGGTFRRGQADDPPAGCTCRTYATVQDAIASPPETLAYVPAIRVGTKSKDKADYLATIDLDPGSASYGKVIHRLNMPYVGDELHHFGWSSCSSCHQEAGSQELRRFLVLPGIHSSRIYIVDTKDPRQPRIHKIIEPQEVFKKSGLSAPHTVHCLATGEIMISMLGDTKGQGPGGFMLLNQEFEVVGRWEEGANARRFNYDFWYQPRKNIMVSSEWGAPNTVRNGFKPEDVAAGRYGDSLHFWDWKAKRVIQTIPLGEKGRIPLEVRFHHDPASAHGFVGAALSSVIWHWNQAEVNGPWGAEPVIEVAPIEHAGWSFPVPGLVTDVVLSMDDRFLYFSNWLHGDIRQYDVSDPSRPKLTGQVWLGGVLGRGASRNGKALAGGPQMLQLSLDGRRLYVSNSLYSPWDDQFYPQMKEEGSWLTMLECDTTSGGLKWQEGFFVDFGSEPDGPARAHEIRFPTGDCTSDIWS